MNDETKKVYDEVKKALFTDKDCKELKKKLQQDTMGYMLMLKGEKAKTEFIKHTGLLVSTMAENKLSDTAHHLEMLEELLSEYMKITKYFEGEES